MVTETLFQKIEELEAEIARMRSFIGCDGCSTGDCPHDTVHDCVKAQGAIIEAATAEIELLNQELETTDWWPKVHKAEAEVERLKVALLATVKVVRGYHGKVAWPIYRDNCPELQAARDVLGVPIKVD